MKALVLAAGMGTRAADITESKPLLRVMGLPLVERTIATAMRAGIDEFVVVTGHQADRLEPRLVELAKRRRVPIRIVRADGWAAGNGASLLAARDHFDEPFLLMMSDHVVSEAIPKRLIAHGLRNHSCVLAVDHGESPWVDPLDVTRVHLDGDRITALGKGLPDSEIFDTGVFLCGPDVFDAAERALSRGDGSLTGAVRELAARRAAGALDVSGEPWIDVDTRRDARHAHQLLAGEAGKLRDGWVSRRLNRPISRRVLTPVLLRLRPSVTANEVSLLSFLVGGCASAGFAAGQPIVGGLLAHLASVMDGSDGEIARLKQLESPFGQFFDAVLDRYTDSMILFALLYFTWTASGTAELLGPALDPVLLFTGMLAVSGNWLVSYTTARAAADLGHQYEGRWIAGGRGRDARLLIVATAGLAAALHPVAALVGLGAIGALTNAIVLRRLFVSRAVANGADRFAAVNAVIYDLDGTLIDSMPALTEIATELIAQRYEVSAEAARCRYLETTGADFATQLEELFPKHPANADISAAFELRKAQALDRTSPFDDALPTLRRFRSRGVRQFVCSSTRHELVAASLRRSGLVRWLDGYIGHQPGRDKARQIGKLVNEHGLDPRMTLFVGDSPRDADFARSAGVRFRGVSRRGEALRLARLGADVGPDLRSLVREWERARRAARAARTAVVPMEASYDYDAEGVPTVPISDGCGDIAANPVAHGAAANRHTTRRRVGSASRQPGK